MCVYREGLYIYTCIHTYIHTCKVHNCSQSFPNVYIHRDGGVQDRTCASRRLPMRDLLSAPWMVKYAQNPEGSKCSPLLPPPDAHVCVYKYHVYGLAPFFYYNT